MSTFATKRNVILLSLVAGLLALITSGRTWVDGSLNDGVVSSNAVHVSGNQAVPGYFGIALVALAGVLAAATTGRIARWPSAIASLIASIALVVVTMLVLRDPSSAVKSRMTTVTGHNGDALARGTFTAWFWVAVFAALLSVIASGLALMGLRRWAGLSSRYDAPVEREEAKAERRSDWDLMSAGIDPTQAETPESHEDHAPDTMTQNTSMRDGATATERDDSPSKER